MTCLECGRSCHPCERCGKCESCCQCDDPVAAVSVAPRFWRGFRFGVLLSVPIWAAIIVFGFDIYRAIEHFSHWSWMVQR